MRLKSLAPVLILGAVLAAIVFTARFTQRELYERENRTDSPPAATSRVETPAADPNSVANEQEEAARFAREFADWTAGQRGMRYKILREGNGRRPVSDNMVTAHYRGRLLDGTVFDASYATGNPIRFRLNRGNVILGWDLTILEMSAGEVRQVVIPYKLAYGEMGKPPKIPARAPLIFEIELVEFR